jgi:uncharacterized protein involved in exopolysaccharide biosynthesis
VEPVAILDVLRRHVIMIIAVCLVAAVAGYAFSFLLPEQYSASALVLVRPQQPLKMGTSKGGKEFLDFPMGESSVVETPGKTYIEIIKSPELIGKIVRKLGLDKVKEVPSDSVGIVKSVKDLLKTVPTFLKYGRLIEEDPFARAIKGVGDSLSLKSIAETYVFEIKYDSADPKLAADVANTTASMFIALMEEIRQAETQQVRDQLRVKRDQAQQHLEDARRRLEDYKKAHSVFLYETEYNSQLKLISDLEVELAKADEALVGNQNTLMSGSLAAKRAMVRRLIDERRAELGALPHLEHELRQLDENVKSAATAYEIIDKEFQQADVNYSYAMPEVRLVSRAEPPRLPSSPRRGTVILVCLLAGLIVAVSLALFLEFLNRRVRSIGDVEDFVGVKVLATIPRISQLHWARAGMS